ncbi:peptidoglycan-binding protein [Dactylosporangium sp. NBC_01737]|uniref:peptidoglycan-binding domain-containing protein n=1 Tax=Dactylosporangium sp. NBC_01737 TaxID=2975959 RepID=UPI002E0FD03F|nr:peptidoglycan-binding protein [Dactylosporangium sp. NBC_01737]
MNRTRAGLGLAALAGATVIAAIQLRAGGTAAPQPAAVATGTAEVRRADVSERQHVTGTLGYEGATTVTAPGPGVLTGLPAVGTVVRRGQTAYEVDGKPVILLYGQRPTWRPLQAGMTDGVDVRQLEHNLTALGHGAGLTVDDHFTAATTAAVRRWQRAAGLTVTGAVPLGQVVFVPDAIRVAGHDLALGVPLDPGVPVEHGTSDTPAVTIQLSPRQLPTAKVGDPVVVILPDGATRTGQITSIGAVTVPAATGGGPAPQPAAPVAVRLDGAAPGFLDQAQVQVAITVAAHRGVLAVPINALNAAPSGGYEVIVVDGSGTRRVPVRTVLFDEFAGLAEVTGPGLAEEQKVQVPDEDA